MLTKIPKFIRRFFPNRLWEIATEEKVLYLTFDDGPIPEVTPWVLEQLKEYNAHATFFCTGDNIQKHPNIFKMIISEGHSVGNHTYNHLNGWKTTSEAYVKNIILAEKIISELSENESEKRENRKEIKEGNNEIKMSTTGSKPSGNSSSVSNSHFKIFRPPYGRMTCKQAKLLQKRNYKIVMWDVLSKDYSNNISPESCFQNVIKHSGPGSIIVFHDSLKAKKNLRIILPWVLEYYSTHGFIFSNIQR